MLLLPLWTVEKCNMRLDINIKPKEATFQVVLDALALTPFYQTFLITAEVPAIYIQTFKDLLLEHDILSFIIDLGHSRDIIYLPDIENKEAKKTNKISYPRFTKIIIDYFMSKDQSISRRNKMFWHIARDVTMFTSMICISKHEDTQIYGTILPKELTNQAMLESKVYKTYYAFASGEKSPKPKYVRKKTHSDTSPKQKPVQATKCTRLKTKAKVAKSDKKKQLAKMPKAKGYVLSKGFMMSNISKRLVQMKELWRRNEDDESNSVDKSDDYEFIDDEKIHDEENINDEEMMDEEEDGVTKELYKDVNVNLGNEDTKMIDADQADNEIASLLNTIVHHATAVPEITSSFTKIIPLTPSFFNLVPHQATPTLTPTTSEATTSFLSLLDFSFVS
nr:hypothetical protein [Tanacetum cinerariifolium]